MASFKAKIKYDGARKTLQVFEASLEEAKKLLQDKFPNCIIVDIVRENELRD